MRESEGVRLPDIPEPAREGGQDALDMLLRENHARLLAWIRRRLGRRLRPHLEAGDILQITLMRAFRSIGQFRGQSRESLLSWLTSIAKNVIRDEVDYLLRQRRCIHKTVSLGSEPELAPAETRSPVSLLIAREEADRLERILLSLDARRREVILLRSYEGLSFREIGQRLGRSPDACRMLLARGLRTLARKLASGGESSEGLLTDTEDLAAAS
jgi:RNA polymerase sigma-70 factor (ECF subfamily)